MIFVLRPFQKQVLQALDNPGHVICISATGSGKSLIFERWVSAKGRKMLLVSPLIALALQQARRLSEAGIQTRVNAGGIQEVPDHKTQAWIVSPESLQAQMRKGVLKNWKPDLMVVDECHCVWEWGAKFRPAFHPLPELLLELGIQRSLWLTATLPPSARSALRSRLPQPIHEIGSFALPTELFITVRRSEWNLRLQHLLDWQAEQVGSGIVFSGTRESTERLCRLFRAMGKSALSYHAGLSQEERRLIEERIVTEAPEIVVATSAFGMGMHFSALKWAVLWNAPRSLLELTQAIGRVGRGSEKANSLVLWDRDDFRMMESTDPAHSREAAEMKSSWKFLNQDACRKVALTHYFEGASTMACKNGCDFCVNLAEIQAKHFL